MLDLPKDMFNGVVCFMGDAKFKTDVPKGVYFEGRYINHIKSFTTLILTREQLNDVQSSIATGE